MTRYVIRQRYSDDLDCEVIAPDTMTVIESEPERDTGLTDRHGNPIFRIKDAIGFVRNE